MGSFLSYFHRAKTSDIDVTPEQIEAKRPSTEKSECVLDNPKHSSHSDDLADGDEGGFAYRLPQQYCGSGAPLSAPQGRRSPPRPPRTPRPKYATPLSDSLPPPLIYHHAPLSDSAPEDTERNDYFKVKTFQIRGGDVTPEQIEATRPSTEKSECVLEIPKHFSLSVRHDLADLIKNCSLDDLQALQGKPCGLSSPPTDTERNDYFKVKTFKIRGGEGSGGGQGGVSAQGGASGGSSVSN